MKSGTKIAVFGTGVVGQTLAHKLSELGHQVFVGTRDPAATLAKAGTPSFKTWRDEHPGVAFGTFSEAAAFAEAIVNATSGGGTLEAFRAAGEEHLDGKVVIDLANPLDFSKGFPPSLSVCNTDSLGEQLQRAFPKLKVVKTLNTMNANLMVNPELLAGGEHSVFMSGNDAGAKESVAALLRSFGWRDVVDVGDITTARGTEMLLPIWVRLYGKLQSPMFQFKLVR